MPYVLTHKVVITQEIILFAWQPSYSTWIEKGTLWAWMDDDGDTDDMISIMLVRFYSIFFLRHKQHRFLLLSSPVGGRLMRWWCDGKYHAHSRQDVLISSFANSFGMIIFFCMEMTYFSPPPQKNKKGKQETLPFPSYPSSIMAAIIIILSTHFIHFFYFCPVLSLVVEL